MQIRQSLIMIKPDAFERNIVGEILTVFERLTQDSNFRIVNYSMLRLNRDVITSFYQHHKEKPFFKELVDFMNSVVMLLVIESASEDVIKRCREEVLRIREKYTATSENLLTPHRNLVHSSDSDAAFKMEYNILFY